MGSDASGMLGFCMVFHAAGRLTLLTAALIFMSQSATSAPVLTDFNLVVGGNLSSTSEVEGRTLIGGTLSGPSSTYGVRLAPSSAFSDVASLIVGGDITAGTVNVEAGDVYVGGTASGIVNRNGVGSDLVQNDPNVSGIIASVLAQMNSFSSYFGGLATNSAVNNPAGPSAVTFNALAGPNNVAVFNIDGNIFSDQNSQQYDLNYAAGVDAIVVNVSGSSINFNQGNFTGAFRDLAIRPYLLWNFVDAENISLDRNWFGAILAPKANLTNSTAIDGSVFIGGNFNQRGEVHLPLFDSSVPDSPVPEPGTVTLLFSSLVATAALRKYRSGQVSPR